MMCKNKNYFVFFKKLDFDPDQEMDPDPELSEKSDPDPEICNLFRSDTLLEVEMNIRKVII